MYRGRPSSDGRALIRFASETGLREAVNAFGGGVRGLFRIERRRAPGTSPSVVTHFYFEIRQYHKGFAALIKFCLQVKLLQQQNKSDASLRQV